MDKMNISLLLLALFVAVVAGNTEEECEAEATACIETLLETVESEEDEQACNGLRVVVQCLTALTDECVKEEEREEANTAFEELHSLLKTNCAEGDDVDEEEILKCVMENESYLYACAAEAPSKAIDLIQNSNIEDTDGLLCLMYGLFAECIVDRTGEKCGEEARQEAEREMSDLPEDIEQACEAGNSVELEVVATRLIDHLERRK